MSTHETISILMLRAWEPIFSLFNLHHVCEALLQALFTVPRYYIIPASLTGHIIIELTCRQYKVLASLAGTVHMYLLGS